MSFFNNVTATPADGAALDAFGRQRFSAPRSLFNSKALHSKLPEDWDEALTGGATSVHNDAKAAIELAVPATTAASAIRQTRRRFNYASAKSTVWYWSFNFKGVGGTGIIKRLGQYDQNNGLFLQTIDGVVSFGKRSTAGGAGPVDDTVEQTNWNLDPLNGTGPSGVTLDWTKTQVVTVDYQWLGSSRVRLGFIIDGVIVYAHEFLNANNFETVYMSTPNNPLRCELINDGTGGADNFEPICCSVVSEGGTEPNGRFYYGDTGPAGGAGQVVIGNGDTVALLGIRLKGTTLDAAIQISGFSLLGTAVADVLKWRYIVNPTIDGTVTWDTTSYPSVDFFVGDNTNTITTPDDAGGGSIVLGEVGTGRTILDFTGPEISNLSSQIDGTPDELILAVSALDNAVTARATLNFRELA